MRINRHISLIACIEFLVLLLTLACSALFVAPAHAAARRSSATGDTLTLSLTNGTSFTYKASQGSPSPRFQVTVTLGQPFTKIEYMQVILRLENGQTFSGSASGPASDQITYTANIIASAFYGSSGDPTIGDHSAYATVTNPETGQQSQSNTVNFTISKLNFSLSCAVDGSMRNIFKPGVVAQVSLSAQNMQSNLPLNWNEGTATVTFSGPTTTTFQSLQPDSNGVVTVKTPPLVGRYNIDCSFSGTSYYAASAVSWTTFPLLISEMSQLGGVQLYTNPTTIVGKQPIELYIVFRAASGLPTPTGQYNVTIGTNPMLYTKSINLGPNGDSQITIQPNPNATFGSLDQITIHYFGDGYYDDQSYNFPMTNPPIPSANGGGSGGGGVAGTAPTQPKATGTPNAVSTTTATVPAGGATNSSPAPTTSVPTSTPNIFSIFTPLSWTNGALWLVALVLLLAVGAGVGTFVWFGRRGGNDSSLAPIAPIVPPERARLDDDTLPFRR